VNIYNPKPFKVGTDELIVGGACGAKHTLVVTRSGSLFSAGSNEYGQCGLGRSTPEIARFSAVATKHVTQVAAGRAHSLLLTAARETYAFGCPEYGQLGNDTDGKILERAGKVTFLNETSPIVVEALVGVPIDAVACGANHSVAVDEEGKVYTWGFAGYGRLGHGDNKDLHVPKMLEFFANEQKPRPPSIPAFMWRSPQPRRAQHVACGQTATYLVDLNGALYMWGITKRAGEAFMRPTVVEDVSGWTCRSVACGNTSTIVAAEESLITWGSSPTYGELGYGEDGARSSTRANEVEDIKGSYVLQVAMGYAHSFAIVRVEGDHATDVRAREAIAALPLYAPAEPDASTGAPAAGGAKSSGGKRKATKRAKGKGAKKKKGEEESP
jgi:alpha-tubulin suppressor-like RCC1 family protein